ncbi:DUF3078 domain-containing protein [bacterium]|nr:DUF3078 domain-containing protein [bacterium]
MTKCQTLQIALGVFFLLSAGTTLAELPVPGPWKIGLETGLGLTQASYSDNWTGGEAGSIIWAWHLHATAERQYSSPWFHGNELKLEFGQSHSQNKDNKQWAKPEKSADKIRFDSILRYTRGWFVDPYVAGTFESQFLDASGIEKRYINPIDLTESTGIARVLVDVPDVRKVTSRVGAGFRQHLTKKDDPADPTKTLSETTTDGGLEWVTDLTLGAPKKKYSFTSKLTLFQALFYSESENLKGLPNEDYWKTVDMNWDNVLRANVTSLLQVSMAWQLLYDKEISLGGRLKETITVGLAYAFARPNEPKE